MDRPGASYRVLTHPVQEGWPLIGTTVGSYRIVERLAAGAMGEVYLGEHVRIVRRVAVKFLLSEFSGNRPLVDRFFMEARATSSIRHPGIVEIFDCDIDPGGRAYIVMEFLAGESLAERLARDADFGFDIDRALGTAEEIASALAAAHASGIVHRDLKPDNVFLVHAPSESSLDRVKILDFGIAKLFVDTAEEKAARASATLPGTILGTPKYMSPEQCRDASNVDHRTDLYSLGCLLFEMLAGRPPFVAESLAELVVAHLSQDPPALGSLRQGIPDTVGALVGRLLAKEPAQRPADMDAVRGEIARIRAALAGRRSTPALAAASGTPAFRESTSRDVAFLASVSDVAGSRESSSGHALSGETATGEGATGETATGRTAARRRRFFRPSSVLLISIATSLLAGGVLLIAIASKPRSPMPVEPATPPAEHVLPALPAAVHVEAPTLEEPIAEEPRPHPVSPPKGAGAAAVEGSAPTRATSTSRQKRRQRSSVAPRLSDAARKL